MKIRPPRVHTPSPHPSPAAQEAAVALRLEQTKASRVAQAAKAEEKAAKIAAANGKPNRLRKMVPPAAAALGIVLVGNTVIGPVMGSISEKVDSILNGNQTESTLKQPIGDVKADLKTGEIDPSGVIKITIPEKELAWTAATNLVGEGQPVQTVSDIIVEQQGAQLYKGEQVVLPEDAIDPQQIQITKTP